jgi:hypothetical protein
MVDAHIDELPLTALPDRYGVARSQVYNRIAALGIQTEKRGNRGFVNAQQIALLDRMADLINGGETLEKAAAIILQDSPVRPSPRTSQNGQNGVSSLAMAPAAAPPADPSALLQLLGAMAAPPPPPSPLARFEQLQAIADNDWRPSSSELADILGLNTLSGQQFERYGFRFTRAGKNGPQSAWKVEKLSGRK